MEIRGKLIGYLEFGSAQPSLLTLSTFAGYVPGEEERGTHFARTNFLSLNLPPNLENQFQSLIVNVYLTNFKVQDE